MSFDPHIFINMINESNIFESESSEDDTIIICCEMLKYIYKILKSIDYEKINNFKNLMYDYIKSNGNNIREIISYLYKNISFIFKDSTHIKYVVNFFKDTPQKTNDFILLYNNYASNHKIRNFKNSPFTIYAYASYMAYQEQPLENPIINRFFEKHIITKKYENTNVFKILVTHKVKQNGKIERNYIIAFKGTEPLNINDLKSDINIVLKNKENDGRFQYCLAFVNMFKSIPKYNRSKIILTGHSLGGSIAIYVASKLNLPCVVFNPGTSIEQNANYNNKMLIIHKCYEDPICTFAGFSGTTFIYRTGKNALESHSLENFLQLKN